MIFCLPWPWQQSACPSKIPLSFLPAPFSSPLEQCLPLAGLEKSWLTVWSAKKEWENALAVSLAIQLVTGPIVLYHFFEYPLYGIFLNFLVIPLMTYVVGAGIAGLLMGMAGISLLAAAAGFWTVWRCGSGGPSAGAWRSGKHGNLPLHFCMVYEMLCRLSEASPLQLSDFRKARILEAGGLLCAF